MPQFNPSQSQGNETARTPKTRSSLRVGWGERDKAMHRLQNHWLRAHGPSFRYQQLSLPCQEGFAILMLHYNAITFFLKNGVENDAFEGGAGEGV